MTSHIQQAVNAVILEILAQHGRGGRELQASDSFSKDLGFASLDVAQLIATLEMELGVDPFSAGLASIGDVHTVARLYAVYDEALAAAT